jgi:MFS family permease
MVHDTQELIQVQGIIGPFANLLCVFIDQKKLLSTRKMILIGGSVTISCVFASSFIKTFSVFLFVFGFSFGFLSFFKTLILYKAWLHFPGHEGKVSGIVYAGFGTGGFVSIVLSSYWTNPHNELSKEININDRYDKPFDHHVADNLPIMLRKMCVLWVCYLIVAIIMFRYPPNKISPSKFSIEEDPRFTEIDSTPQDVDELMN